MGTSHEHINSGSLISLFMATERKPGVQLDGSRTRGPESATCVIHVDSVAGVFILIQIHFGSEMLYLVACLSMVL